MSREPKPKRQVKSVRTGHPPPERQIAGQVRTATGYTQGIAHADGAKLIALPFTSTGTTSRAAYRPLPGAASPRRLGSQ